MDWYVEEYAELISVEKGYDRNQDAVERCMAYLRCLKPLVQESQAERRKIAFLERVVFKEGEIERKVYRTMKVWERRHPLLAIVLGTVLGAVLLELIAGIVLEAALLAML